MGVVFHHGEFLSEGDISISSSNRAFNYGDGFFESIKIINSKPFNFYCHFERIKFALSVLKINSNYTAEFFKEKISYLLKVNKIVNGSIKIHISRSGSGKYLPELHQLDLLIKSFNGNPYKQNDTISLCFYDKEFKGTGFLSNIKSANALVSVLASVYADDNNFNNAILLSPRGNIIEVANANIFIVNGEKIYTPPLSDGCVDGTMRKWICSNINIFERTILKSEILDADEVFITNATSGVVSVNNIEQTYFSSFNLATSLQKKLINLSLGL
jgi:branched-chain amino acid aminotransferase